MGRFLPQTHQQPTFIHPRRGEGISKHSMSTSLFSPCPHSSSAPSLSAPRCQLRVHHLQDPSPWHSGARKPHGEWQVSSFLPAQPQAKLGLFPSSLWEGGGVGVLPGVVSRLVRGPWAPPTGQLSPGQWRTDSGNSAQEQWGHSHSPGFAQ